MIFRFFFLHQELRLYLKLLEHKMLSRFPIKSWSHRKSFFIWKISFPRTSTFFVKSFPVEKKLSTIQSFCTFHISSAVVNRFVKSPLQSISSTAINLNITTHNIAIKFHQESPGVSRNKHGSTGSWWFISLRSSSTYCKIRYQHFWHM